MGHLQIYRYSRDHKKLNGQDFLRARKLLHQLNNVVMVYGSCSLSEEIRTEGFQLWKSLTNEERDALVDEALTMQETNTILNQISQSLNIESPGCPNMEITLGSEEIDIDIDLDESAEYVFW